MLKCRSPRPKSMNRTNKKLIDRISPLINKKNQILQTHNHFLLIWKAERKLERFDRGRSSDDPIDGDKWGSAERAEPEKWSNSWEIIIFRKKNKESFSFGLKLILFFRKKIENIFFPFWFHRSRVDLIYLILHVLPALRLLLLIDLIGDERAARVGVRGRGVGHLLSQRICKFGSHFWCNPPIFPYPECSSKIARRRTAARALPDPTELA